MVHDYLESVVRDGSPSSFFENIEIFHPPVNPKTGKPYGTATKAYQEAIAECGEYITPQEADMLKDIYNSLMSCPHQSPMIRNIIKVGEPEVSTFIETDEGAKLKYRPDVSTLTKIVDWKTIRSDLFSLDGIRKQIQAMGYDFSAAMYQWLEYLKTGTWKRFYWVFIESAPPYDFLIVDASPWAFDVSYNADMQIVETGQGAYMFNKVLEQHNKCLEHEEWDGLVSMVQPEFYGKRKLRIADIKPSSYHTSKELFFYND